MLIGYAWVFSKDQNLELQIDELKKVAAQKYFQIKSQG